jgi:hypothetical protein
VTIRYDLKRLPQPVTGVDVYGGPTVYFNIYKGQWIDQDLFKPADGEAAPPPELPEINLGEQAKLMLRADGIFVPPEDLTKGQDWYVFALNGLSLLADTTSPERYRIQGSVENQHFKTFILGGHVDRKGGGVEVEFRTSKPLHFNRDYAAVLAEDVRDTVEQFSIDVPTTKLKGKLRIVPGKDLQFDALVGAEDGKVCFVGFPLLVEDVSADIVIRNNNIVVNAIGRRNGAEVKVDVDVDRIGEDRETLNVSVRIRELLVDEAFRLALLNTRLQPDNQNYRTGMPFCVLTTTVSGPSSGCSCGASAVRLCALTPRNTTSAAPMVARSPVTCGRTSKSPSSLSTRSPRASMARRCGPRANRTTSAPARASRAPMYPPIAPAPAMAILMRSGA